MMKKEIITTEAEAMKTTTHVRDIIINPKPI